MKITFRWNNTREEASRFPDSTYTHVVLVFVLFLYFVQRSYWGTLISTNALGSIVSTCFSPMLLSFFYFFLLSFSPYSIFLLILFSFPSSFTPVSFLPLHALISFFHTFQRQFHPPHFPGISAPTTDFMFIFSTPYFWMIILKDISPPKFSIHLLSLSTELYFKTNTFA
jgi:hypothetical protein